MSDKVFVDTNLWVYAFVKNPPEKADKIVELTNVQQSSLVISVQVLGELYNVLVRKSTFPQSEAQAIILGLVSRFSIVEIDTSNVLQAMTVNTRYRYSYWDCLIIATALKSDCYVLYSEDMQHDQLIEGKLRIINPLL
jgi:predicted nucleic acid-binding protein